jgi:hypothetical protein
VTAPNLDRGVRHVRVAIVKKSLTLSASLYEILQILRLTMFERIPFDQLLLLLEAELMSDSINQLNLHYCCNMINCQDRSELACDCS